MRPFRMQGLQLRPLGPGCAPRPRMRPAGPPRAQPTAQLPPRPAPGRGPRGTRPRGQGPREGGRCPRPRAPSSPSPACGGCGWSSPAGRNVLRLYFQGFSVASSHVMGNCGKPSPPAARACAAAAAQPRLPGKLAEGGRRAYESLSSVWRVARAVSTSTPSSSDWTTGDSPPSLGSGAAGSVPAEDGEAGVAGGREGSGTCRRTPCSPGLASGPATHSRQGPVAGVLPLRAAPRWCLNWPSRKAGTAPRGGVGDPAPAWGPELSLLRLRRKDPEPFHRHRKTTGARGPRRALRVSEAPSWSPGHLDSPLGALCSHAEKST